MNAPGMILCYKTALPGVLVCPACITEAEASEEEPGYEVVLRADEWASTVVVDGCFCVRCAAMFEDGEFRK